MHDRCHSTITGCTLGHRTLKYVDHANSPLTLVNLTTSEAIRVTIRESCEIKGSPEDVVQKMAKLPKSEVVSIQKVKVPISDFDLPGFPKKEGAMFGLRRKDNGWP